ncbi:MAG: ABC transporter permease subunit [Woeseiaceae bacterium]|nr:ABC transporter permease subunit [Woeseiaceae bacterium]
MQNTGALRYALLRLLAAIPTLLLVIVIAFLMVRAAPGGPFDEERALPADIEANIERAFHLDESLPAQFWRYVSGLARGDLGPSYRYRDYGVAELMRAAIPLSLLLGSLALLVALLAGVGGGIAAALARETAADRLLSALAMSGISVPVFVVAPVLVLVFAVFLGWLPASWSGGSGGTRLVLPVIALALPQVAYVMRLTRASMIDVLQSDYIRTARAQGLSTAHIVRRHALKPAMLPLLSYMGPAIAALLTGSVVVEEIFGIPGVGQLFVRGAANRDYTLVLGIVIFYAALVIVLNLLVDVCYGFLDPRIRRR